MENIELDRKKVLKRKDLESLQEEFLKQTTPNTLSVKLNKENKLTNSKSENSKERKVGKKTKDIIRLDMDIDRGSDIPKKESLFIKALGEFKHIKNNAISKETGLPETFKIADFEKYVTQKNNKTNNNYLEVLENETIKDDEYKDIHAENVQLIKDMSKDDLVKYAQMLKTSVPPKLLEKMKSGHYQKTFKKELKIAELPDKLEEIENGISIPSEEINKTTPKVKVIGYNYNAEYKYIEDIDIKDYSKISFNDLELSNRYFSLKELSNLANSTLDNHILIGLKIIKKVLAKYYLENINNIKGEFETYNLPTCFLLYLDSRNINIHIIAYENLTTYFNYTYKTDWKEFKYNLFYFNNFPVHKKQYQNSLIVNLNSSLQRYILHFKQSLAEPNINMINHYLEVLFYMLFMSNDFTTKFLNSEVLSIFKDIIVKLSTQSNTGVISTIFKIVVFICCFDFSLLSFFMELLKSFDGLLKFNYLTYLYGLKDTYIDLHALRSNGRTIDIVTFTQLINNKTVSDISSSNLTNLELIIDYPFEKSLLRMSKIMAQRCKIFKYMNSLDEEYFILNKQELSGLNDELQKSFLFFNVLIEKGVANTSMITINIYIDFWTQILFTIKLSNKYPQSIKYQKGLTKDELLVYLKKLIKQIEIFNYFIKHDTSDYSLYIRENFLKLLLNLVKQDDIILPELYYYIPNLMGSCGEYYYQKYLKYLNRYLHNQLIQHKPLSDFIKKTNFSFDSLNDDLNLYLSSNEDVRRSAMFKHIFNVNNILYNEKSHKSKYFPFKKNFILQIIHNDKLQHELKLNYIILIIMLFYDSSEFIEIEPFNLLLKTVIYYRDVIYKNKAEEMFCFYIKKLILPSLNNHSFVMKRNKENDLIKDLFFSKFETSLDEIELSFYYKLVFLMVILLHSDIKTKSYDNKNITDVLYSNFIKLYEYLDNLIFIKQDEYNTIIHFIETRLDLKYSEIYEVLILNYFKHKSYKFSDNNILTILVKMLIRVFNVDENSKDLRDIIFNKLK
jgi:hypothetical protein